MKNAIQSFSKTEGMLGSFRRKFVATNMVFAGIVLLVVFATTSFIIYNQHQEDVYEALDHRIELARQRNNMFAGSYDMFPNPMQGQAFENRMADAPDYDLMPRESSSDQFVATALFMLDEDNSLIAAYDEAFPLEGVALSQALAHVIKDLEDEPTGADRLQGVINDHNLYYQIEPFQHGHLVAFASRKYIDRNMRGFIVPLLCSELAALAAFLLISLLLARWAIEPIKEAWDKQSQFIADASHELKTPLTVIRANDSILLSQPQSSIEAQSQWIESTETEAQLMQDLVNDMLYLAKAENAQEQLTFNTVDFTELVDGLLLQFEAVAFEKNLTLNSRLAPNVMLDGDIPRLQRLVGTLLDNACRYTDEGGTVDADLRVAGKSCILAVHNEGEPIDPEDLPHLFDRFYRGDKARTRSQEGYGLGLAIAKSIVEEHNGTIRVASNAENGTTFTVEIPLQS